MKKVLKFIFPYWFLLKIYFICSRIKINTIDRILYREYKFNDNDFLIRRKRPVYDDLHIDESALSFDVVDSLKVWHGWTSGEYLLKFEHSCLIEPRNGWGIADRKLIYPSLRYSIVVGLRKPKLRDMYLLPAHVDDYDQIISLRDTAEENYFHFYNDVLAKLCFLDEKLGLPLDIPVLISGRLYAKPYFQFFLANSELVKQRNWVVHKDQYIRSKVTYFCEPMTHTKKYLDAITSSLPFSDKRIIHPRKIFLYRNPKRMRFLSNMEEVAVLAKRYSFEVVDADELTFSEQISCFSDAICIVGIHGAGFTNMMYCRLDKVKIVELFPPKDYVNFYYVMLSALYNFSYDAMWGRNASLNGGFEVDLKELEQKFIHL